MESMHAEASLERQADELLSKRIAISYYDSPVGYVFFGVCEIGPEFWR
jgi:hypothetical protein